MIISNWILVLIHYHSQNQYENLTDQLVDKKFSKSNTQKSLNYVENDYLQVVYDIHCWWDNSMLIVNPIEKILLKHM